MLSNVRVAALLPTTDLETAKEFYGNTLGLKLLPIEGPVVYEAGAGSTLELCHSPQRSERLHLM